jgi:hypothetical protein
MTLLQKLKKIYKRDCTKDTTNISVDLLNKIIESLEAGYNRSNYYIK